MSEQSRGREVGRKWSPHSMCAVASRVKGEGCTQSESDGASPACNMHGLNGTPGVGTVQTCSPRPLDCNQHSLLSKSLRYTVQPRMCCPWLPLPHTCAAPCCPCISLCQHRLLPSWVLVGGMVGARPSTDLAHCSQPYGWLLLGQSVRSSGHTCRAWRSMEVPPSSSECARLRRCHKTLVHAMQPTLVTNSSAAGCCHLQGPV